MSSKWVLMLNVLAAILLFAAAPVISVVIAGTIAEANGCTLHEGFANPCVVGGADIGGTLYAMGVLGWFMLVTIPAGVIALVVWTVVAVVMALAGRRRPPEAQS